MRAKGRATFSIAASACKRRPLWALPISLPAPGTLPCGGKRRRRRRALPPLIPALAPPLAIGLRSGWNPVRRRAGCLRIWAGGKPAALFDQKAWRNGRLRPACGRLLWPGEIRRQDDPALGEGRESDAARTAPHAAPWIGPPRTGRGRGRGVAFKASQPALCYGGRRGREGGATRAGSNTGNLAQMWGEALKPKHFIGAPKRPCIMSTWPAAWQGCTRGPAEISRDAGEYSGTGSDAACVDAVPIGPWGADAARFASAPTLATGPAGCRAGSGAEPHTWRIRDAFPPDGALRQGCAVSGGRMRGEAGDSNAA